MREKGESSLGEVGEGVEDDCRSSLGRDRGLSCTIGCPQWESCDTACGLDLGSVKEDG